MYWLDSESDELRWRGCRRKCWGVGCTKSRLAQIYMSKRFGTAEPRGSQNVPGEKECQEDSMVLASEAGLQIHLFKFGLNPGHNGEGQGALGRFCRTLRHKHHWLMLREQSVTLGGSISLFPQ